MTFLQQRVTKEDLDKAEAALVELRRMLKELELA